MYAYSLSFLNLLPTTHHPTPRGHHRAELSSPCLQQVPLTILHIVVLYIDATLDSSHPLLPPLRPQVHSLHLHAIPALQTGSSVLFFLDSIYMY